MATADQGRDLVISESGSTVKIVDKSGGTTIIEGGHITIKGATVTHIHGKGTSIVSGGTVTITDGASISGASASSARPQAGIRKFKDHEIDAFARLVKGTNMKEGPVRKALLKESAKFRTLSQGDQDFITNKVANKFIAKRAKTLRQRERNRQKKRAAVKEKGPQRESAHVPGIKGGQIIAGEIKEEEDVEIKFEVDSAFDDSLVDRRALDELKQEEDVEVKSEDLDSTSDGSSADRWALGPVAWDTHYAHVHPVPFVGCPCDWEVAAGWHDLYRAIGRDVNNPHPGHPEQGERLPPFQKPSFPLHEWHYMRSFMQLDHAWNGTPDLTVQGISRKLYDLNVGPAFYYETIQKCLSIVAQSLLECSSSVQFAIPVLVESMPGPDSTSPLNTAIILQSTQGHVKIIPCILRLVGSWDQGIPYTHVGGGWGKNKTFHGWTYAASDDPWHREKLDEKVVRKVRSKFMNTPCLSIRDAFMIGINKPRVGWSPRRYADVWKLCWDSSPNSSAYEPLHKRRDMEKNYSELYSSVSILVRRLFEVATDFLVSDLSSLKPFQTLKVDEFTLSLKRPLPALRQGTVNGRPRCRMFEDCNIPRVPGSRYCEYHRGRSSPAGPSLSRYCVEYAGYGAGMDNVEIKSESDEVV